MSTPVSIHDDDPVRLTLLAEAGVVLAGALDADAVPQALAELFVSTIADYCITYERAEDGTVRAVTATQAEDGLAARLDAWLQADRVEGPRHPVRRAMETRQASLITEMGTDALDVYGDDPALRAIVRSVAPRSTLIVPLVVEKRAIGAFALGTVAGGRRPLRRVELALLLEISARAALALENARLHAETLAEVAERKRAEDALRREQHLLQRLIDTMPVMIMVYGPDMQVLRLNREFERVAGWTSEEARVIQLLEVCFPDAEERTELQRFMESPKSGWCDFRMTTRDGRVIETAWAHILLSEQTHVGIGLDISSRKRAERERARLYEAERRARHAAERLQTLTAALSEAVSESAVGQVVLRLGVSALGASAGAIALRASDGELALADSIGFGVDGAGAHAQADGIATLGPLLAAAREGESIFLASPQEWVARYGGAVVCATRGRAWAALPLFVPAGPGALLWAFDEPRPFDEDEQALMHAIARLCTQALERARLFDAERQAREAAEAANRSKSQFLGVMSHELRTPLNAVLGYADLLLMEVRGPLTREQRDQVERIRTSARVQLELIEEILSFARIEAGKEQLRVTVTDVRELAREAASILRPQAEQKHLDLRLDAPVPLPVVTDPAKVRQVILNLAGNAVKFTNAGRIDIVATREGDSIIIHVRDTGPGIPADKHELIWQPFTQLDQSTTREIGGTGLGLAITRRLTRLLGGSIRVDSVPGTGSTFTLRLPAATMFGEA